MRGVRIALKYFTVGLLVGLLLAPRAGAETRRLLVERLSQFLGPLTSPTEPAPPPPI
jgi:hypothetical protein